MLIKIRLHIIGYPYISGSPVAFVRTFQNFFVLRFFVYQAQTRTHKYTQAHTITHKHTQAHTSTHKHIQAHTTSDNHIQAQTSTHK